MIIIPLEHREFFILRRFIFILEGFLLYSIYRVYYETLLFWISYTIGESAVIVLFSIGCLYGRLLLSIFLVSDYYIDFYRMRIYLSSVPVNFSQIWLER